MGHAQTQGLGLRSQFRRCRPVAADHRVAAQQLARVTLQAIAQAVGEEADRREGGHGQHHGHGQQAQFAGAEVAQGLAPGQGGNRRRTRQVHGRTVADSAKPPRPALN